MPADGTLNKRNGQRISEHFFEGEPDIDGYSRNQQSIGYQFEHRFNDVFTARQNFRYLDSKVKLDQVYAYGWTTRTSNDLNRYYSGGHEQLHAFIIDNMLQAEFFTGNQAYGAAGCGLPATQDRGGLDQRVTGADQCVQPDVWKFADQLLRPHQLFASAGADRRLCAGPDRTR